MGYSEYADGETGTLNVKNGSKFIAGSNSAWLGGGTINVTDGSTMEVCNSNAHGNDDRNYRLLMGLANNTMNLNIEEGSTFVSSASQLVTNFNSNTEVKITVTGEGSTFTQNAETVVTGSHKAETVTYLCDTGCDKDGNKYAANNNAHTYIEATDGGVVNIESKTTYIGSAADRAKFGEELNKSANFTVGKDSSISFQQLEVYADTNINFTDASGEFSATGVNLYDGATMNIEKAGSVSLGEVAVGDGAKLDVSDTTLVFTEGANITVNGGSLTLDNVAFELVLNDATGNDFSSFVEFEYDVLKGLTEDAALGYVESLNAGTIDVTIKGLVDGELVALNAGALSFSNDGGTVSIKGSASIPEPTTATLSLLALAALAARRRRK